MRIKRWLLAAAILLIATAGAVAASWFYVRDYLHTPLAVGADGYVIVVPPGTTFGRVTSELNANGILARPRILEWYARATGQANRIKAGEYQIDSGSTPVTLIAQLVAGDVLVYELTLIEGRTFRDALATIQRHPAIVVTLDGLDDGAIMTQLGKPGEHPEGRFFPDTYRFSRGTTDVAMLDRAYRAMAGRLDDAWTQRADDLPLSSAYDALILASIVEKETALASERARIAGVFIRRLRKGMRLQTDPTVIYGLGPGYDGNIRRRDLATDTPYNTYTRSGLPPTPIALPGADALLAAVKPEETDALFFVATGDPDGSHHFSATLAEHNRAVQRYLKRLRGAR